MRDKAIDDFLPALKFVFNWFVTSNIKDLDDILFANDYKLFFDEDSGIVLFSSDEMGILSVDLNSINLDEVNFDVDNLETITHVRLMTRSNRYKQRKSFRKDISKKLMPKAFHPTRWCDWCMPKDEKK